MKRAIDPKVAICLLPGTELAFEDEVRCETGMVFSRRLGHKVARFRQINRGQPNRHHDALAAARTDLLLPMPPTPTAGTLTVVAADMVTGRDRVPWAP